MSNQDASTEKPSVKNQVCTSWKNVTEDILNRKIAIFRIKIPLLTVNTVTENYEELRSFIKCTNDFQYLWFHLERFNEWPSVKPFFSRLIPKLTETKCTYALDFVNKINKREKVYLPSEEIEMNIAMFPPGFNIRHFSFTFLERRRIREEKMPYVSQLLDIPQENLKCVIGITDYRIDLHTDDDGVYNGYSFKPVIERGIAFYGKRLRTVYLRVDPDNHNVKQKFERLKLSQPKIEEEEERCFAFIFCSRQYKESIKVVLEAFTAEFPLVRFVVLYSFPVFVVWNPPENYHFRRDEYVPYIESPCIVFVWYE